MIDESELFTVDVGNTNSSFVHWVDDKPLLKSNKEINKTSKLIVSNVTNRSISLGTPFIHTIHQKSMSSFGKMSSSYGFKAGTDRLVFAYFAFEKINSRTDLEKLLLIDTGTFSTIDIVSKDGFEGGIITPGVKLLDKSFDSGERLNSPKKEVIQVLEKYPFKDTISTLKNSSWFILESIILRIIAEQKIDQILLTGGNGEVLKDRLLSLGITSSFDPLFVHRGIYALYKNEFGQTDLFVK